MNENNVILWEEVQQKKQQQEKQIGVAHFDVNIKMARLNMYGACATPSLWDDRKSFVTNCCHCWPCKIDKKKFCDTYIIIATCIALIVDN